MDPGEKEEEEKATGATSRCQDIPSCSRSNRLSDDPGSDSGKKEQTENTPTMSEYQQSNIERWLMNSRGAGVGSDEEPDDDPGSDSGKKEQMETITTTRPDRRSRFIQRFIDSWDDSDDEPDEVRRDSPFRSSSKSVCSDPGHEGMSSKVRHVPGSRRERICSGRRYGYRNFAWRRGCFGSHDAGPSMNNLHSLCSQTDQLNISAPLGDMNDNRSTAHGRNRDGPREFGDGLPQPTHGGRFPDRITHDGRSESQSPPRLPAPYHDREGT